MKELLEISEHESAWLQNVGSIMLTELGIRQGNSVIDFGCGQGRYTIPLSQIVGEEGIVFAFERDNDAIAIVQNRLPLFSHTLNVKFITTDTMEIASIIEEKSIDSIFVFDVLQYINDWYMLFSSFTQVLKSGGLIHFYPATIPHPNDVNMELAIGMLETLGFKLVNARIYTMMHSIDMVDDMVYSFRLK